MTNLHNDDTFTLGGKTFHSRFILGSGKFSLDLIKAVLEQGEAEIITLALRRANPNGAENILDFIPKEVTLLPNTSGARTAEEAVRIAELSREMGCGNFVKIEVIRDSRWLLPDNYETIKATEILAKRGFVVLPYMYPDYYVTKALEDAGASAIMCNTAIATAGDVKAMSYAFNLAIKAGRHAYLAKTGRVLTHAGEASSPLTGFLGE